MKNIGIITGTVKNIKTYTNDRGTMLTGWLDQRDVSRTSDGTADRTIYVYGVKIIAFDSGPVSDILGASRAGSEISIPMTLTGRMVTKFSKDDKYPPVQQLEVHDVEVHA